RANRRTSRHGAKPPRDATFDAVLRLAEYRELAVHALTVALRPPDRATVHFHFGRRPDFAQVRPFPTCAVGERAGSRVPRFNKAAMVAHYVLPSRGHEREEHAGFPGVEVARKIRVALVGCSVVGVGGVPVDVASVDGVVAGDCRGGGRNHDDVVSHGRIGAVVVVVEGGYLVAHGYATRKDDISPVADAQPVEVSGLRAGVQERGDAPCRSDLARKRRDGANVAPSVHVVGKLAVVLRFEQRRRCVGARRQVCDVDLVPVFVGDVVHVCHGFILLS
ncbi:hypothetical protein EPL73_21500, partial [Clostridioides difficile]|nr:hypothetical protein [Clostridioides difficile]